MKKALYILDSHAFGIIYGAPERADIAKMVDMDPDLHSLNVLQENPGVLADCEVIFSGWGGPHIDEEFLAAAPKLDAVFYGAGSIKGIVSDAFWERGVRISSAYGANAIPVSEYTISQILWCLKRGWEFVFKIMSEGKYTRGIPVAGAYESVVGIISLGMIGRRVCELLRPFDVKVIAYDPFAPQELFDSLGAESVSLDEIFLRSDVVSLHTPWLKETENMITGAHFEMMKPRASFINTSRGAVVNEPEMVAQLAKRPDIFAVLDVTHPEPPPEGSPLFSLPNVVLTPHIAGSMDAECRRMGRYMINECTKYLAGEPMEYEITKETAAKLA